MQLIALAAEGLVIEQVPNTVKISDNDNLFPDFSSFFNLKMENKIFGEIRSISSGISLRYFKEFHIAAPGAVNNSDCFPKKRSAFWEERQQYY